MRSGDLCGAVPRSAGLVQHYRCDDYADGTITNCITGDVVATVPDTAPIGFHREEVTE